MPNSFDPNKAGDINLSRWTREVEPQFDALSHSFVAHLAVDEKNPKRYILVFNGKLKEHAREAIRKYNEKLDIPIEIVDLDRLVQMIETSGLVNDLIKTSGETVNIKNINNANIILGYLLGSKATMMEGTPVSKIDLAREGLGLSVSELSQQFPGIDRSEVSRAIDLLVDSGMIVPTYRSDDHFATPSYRPGEMALRAFEAQDEGRHLGLKQELRAEMTKAKAFLTEKIKLCNPDYIITTDRRGARLIHGLLSNNQLRLHRLVDMDHLDHFSRDDLCHRSILLFDDAIRSGNRMANCLRILEKFGANVFPVCLLAIENMFTTDIKAPVSLRSCDDEQEYVSELSKLGLLLSSCNKPYEPGRPVLRFELGSHEWPQIKKYLSKVGRLTQSGILTPR